jgi:hypothetical protein
MNNIDDSLRDRGVDTSLVTLANGQSALKAAEDLTAAQKAMNGFWTGQKMDSSDFTYSISEKAFYQINTKDFPDTAGIRFENNRPAGNPPRL